MSEIMLPVNDKREWYRTEYLKSDHWKCLKQKKLRMHPMCEICGQKGREPHHLRYKQIFDVEMSDLLTVCRQCHEMIHKRMREVSVKVSPFERQKFNKKQRKKYVTDMRLISYSLDFKGRPFTAFMENRSGIPIITPRILGSKMQHERQLMEDEFKKPIREIIGRKLPQETIDRLRLDVAIHHGERLTLRELNEFVVSELKIFEEKGCKKVKQKK